jgi:hypothetical protein
MKSILFGLSALALTAGLGGCATVTRGTSQQFTVESTPPGAQARTTSGFSCEATPCTFRVQRKDSFTVTVSKAGYKTATADVKPKVASEGAAGFLGNALIGGVIGAAVDVGSGATLDLTPNPLHLTLEAADTPVAAPAPAVAAAQPAPAEATKAAAPKTDAPTSGAPAATPAGANTQ